MFSRALLVTPLTLLLAGAAPIVHAAPAQAVAVAADAAVSAATETAARPTAPTSSATAPTAITSKAASTASAAAASAGAASTATAAAATATAATLAAEAEAGARKLITRFLQVDDRFYRGGQPDAAGLQALRDLGVKTIVTLRTGDSAEAERKLVTALGMTFVQIPISQRPFGVTLPAEAITKFFDIVDNPESGKVFLHCRRGADRTGTFVGLYRIARQGWDSGKAYDEARDIGMRWWYFPMKDRLKDFAASLAPATTAARPAAAATPAASVKAGSSPAASLPAAAVTP